MKSLQHRALVSLQKQIGQPRVDGARGRNRRAAGSGQDDAVHRADARPAAAAYGEGERRHGDDRGRAAGAARGARRGAEDHAGGDPCRRRARARARAARQPAPGRRAARGRRRLLARTPIPKRDLETLDLELLVADRDHVERRLERVEKQAKSGDPTLRKEVEELEALLAHLEAGNSLRDYPGELPAELEPLTTKPLLARRERAGRDRPRSSRRSSRRSPTRRRRSSATAPSALDEVVPAAARRARPDHASSPPATRRRARGRCARGQTALEAAATIHSDIARGFIRCEVIRWDDLVDAGSHAEAARRGHAAARGQDLRRPGRRRPEHPLQRLMADR